MLNGCILLALFIHSHQLFCVVLAKMKGVNIYEKAFDVINALAR